MIGRQFSRRNFCREYGAGCTSLIGAGYKITWDKGEEGEEESEGAEDGEVSVAGLFGVTNRKRSMKFRLATRVLFMLKTNKWLD